MNKALEVSHAAAVGKTDLPLALAAKTWNTEGS